MKTWYPAVARSAPYVNPYTDFPVILADIFQKEDAKEDVELYLPCPIDINIGDTTTCEYHTGLRMYRVIDTVNQHLHTDKSKCFGGFYTVNILPTDI